MELSVLEEYFKFPLSNDDFGCYIFSEPNKLGRRAIAFTWLSKSENQTKDKLVRKINGERIEKSSYTFIRDSQRIIAIKGEEKIPILLVRGWGMLTGEGGFGLSQEKAIEIQDALLDLVVNRLNKKEI